MLLLPNVKDEPRRELARRVPQSELDSDSSFRGAFGRTRRDRSRRWLWRLVGPLFHTLKLLHLVRAFFPLLSRFCFRLGSLNLDSLSLLSRNKEKHYYASGSSHHVETCSDRVLIKTSRPPHKAD